MSENAFSDKISKRCVLILEQRIWAFLHFILLYASLKKKIKEKYHFLDPANPECTPFIWDCH